MSDPNVYENYLLDLGYLLREMATEAKQRANAAPNEPFEAGRAFAYYEVVCLLEQQAKAFQIPLDKLQFQNFDPEKLI
jgi:hypothetical protein